MQSDEKSVCAICIPDLISASLKMYPLRQCIKIRKKDRENFIEAVEYCLENSKCKNEELPEKFRAEIESYRKREFPEERYVSGQNFQFLINTSPTLQKMIRKNEISLNFNILFSAKQCGTEIFFCFGTASPKRADMKSKYGRITSRGIICRGIFLQKMFKNMQRAKPQRLNDRKLCCENSRWFS